MTPLLCGCQNSFGETVQCLIHSGAKVEVKVAESGNGPLHLIAKYYKPTMSLHCAGVLIRNGANLWDTNKYKETPIQLVKSKKCAELLNYFNLIQREQEVYNIYLEICGLSWVIYIYIYINSSSSSSS